MSQVYNVYCDESCYMEHDGLGVMVLGAVWCRLDKAHIISRDLRDLKASNGMSRDFEAKWNKVSPGKITYYLSVIDYFFTNPQLCFRALIIPDKSILDHSAYKQSHDDWYYKMYYQMLEPIIRPTESYHIYMDIKDNRGAEKVKRLHEVLCHSQHDFAHAIIERMQILRSHQVEQFQLTDLLTGAVAYANRNLDTSAAKLRIVKYIEKRSGYPLTKSTSLSSAKVNLLNWHPAESK